MLGLLILVVRDDDPLRANQYRILYILLWLRIEFALHRFHFAETLLSIFQMDHTGNRISLFEVAFGQVEIERPIVPWPKESRGFQVVQGLFVLFLVNQFNRTRYKTIADIIVQIAIWLDSMHEVIEPIASACADRVPLEAASCR